ncbi:hypothetical protein DZJ_49610 [Dickeya ananatis]
MAKPSGTPLRCASSKNSSARIAALLSGDVDMIESVPTADRATIARQQAFVTESVPGNRILYLHPDQDREVSPFAKGDDGKKPAAKRGSTSGDVAGYQP